MAGLQYFLLIAFPVLLLAAAFMDLVTMTIPNRIPLLVLAAFVPAAFAAGLDLHLIGWHLLVGLLALAVCFGMFAMNLIGGGDAKLAAAIAVWIGPHLALLEWTLLFALYGGVLSLFLVAVRRFPLPVPLLRCDWIVRLHLPNGGVPYGIALAGAALTLYPAMAIFAHLAG
jgi:prepilin peptidase CpaA